MVCRLYPAQRRVADGHAPLMHRIPAVDARRLAGERIDHMKIKNRAFTLIELLVVIAIIAILAAILFPVFAKARERAKLSACISNEKQIGLAVMQYTDDYEGVYPMNRWAVPGGIMTWKRAILPMVKSIDVFKCPSVTKYDAINWETKALGDESNSLPAYYKDKSQHLPVSYAYSGGFFFETGAGNNVRRPRRYRDVKDPADTLFILNSRTAYPDLGPWMMSSYCDQNGNSVSGTSPAQRRLGPFVAHQGRIPFIMADGHVQALKLTQTIYPVDMWKSKMTGYSTQAELAAIASKMADEYK